VRLERYRIETKQVKTVCRRGFACDFCGEEIGEDELEHSGTSIEHNAHGSWCDNTVELTVVDCCRNCWITKALPALVVAGAKPRICSGTTQTEVEIAQ